MALPPPIRSGSYDAVKRVLTVRFRVGTYEFSGVPEAVGAAMIVAASSNNGASALDTFHSTIEGKYASKRTGD